MSARIEEGTQPPKPHASPHGDEAAGDGAQFSDDEVIILHAMLDLKKKTVRRTVQSAPRARLSPRHAHRPPRTTPHASRLPRIALPTRHACRASPSPRVACR